MKPTPTDSAASLENYTPRAVRDGIDLYLDANEGRRRPSLNLDPARAATLVRNYPDGTELRALLAEYADRPESEVVMTGGGDDAIDRVCRVFLEPGRTMVVATPTFGMIPRYARAVGAEVFEVPWDDEWPVDEVLDSAPETTAVVAVVTPNNPTGQVVSRADVERLAGAFPRAAVLVDAAYGEFANDDWTLGSDLPDNVIVVRTLSKAWGLAGCRVGYALAQSEVASLLEAAGSPYPVAGLSAEVAAHRLRSGGAFLADTVSRVRLERAELTRLLQSLGCDPIESQGNFVFARVDDPTGLASGLAALGISIRTFGDRVPGAVRISCPGDERDFDRLAGALRAVLRPDALLFDMDGVLADVSNSYREAIVQTAAAFGVTVSRDEIAEAKRRGNANDDWSLTRQLLSDRGVERSLTEVTQKFEALYQEGDDALWRRERPIVSTDGLAEFTSGRKVGIVTGRPRLDADRFLSTNSLSEKFGVVITRDDAAMKPDPAPIRLAMERLSAESAWYVGDTPDDVVAARLAGVVPIGVVAPGEDRAATRAVLKAAGAAFVFDSTEEVLQWIA